MRFASVTLALVAGFATWHTPTVAQACGGTFCDSAATPVNQTGENILFVQGDGFVEAHIQIQYDPEAGAARFAWVVPVMALPELSIGSDSMFRALAASTVPAFGFTRNAEFCDADPCADADDDDWVRFDIGGGSDPSAPNVVSHEIVGAFEMFVLEGGTAQGVMDWLADNGFVQDAAALPILDEYLADGFRFVAFKLAPGVGASEIHPITLRYPASEACVPIRLTRIAAVEDMVLRAYFLGDARAIPTNYRHVEPNPLKLDWLNRGDNYAELVSMAVDEAGGHAWMTEFAGESSVVDPLSIPEADWDVENLRGSTAIEALRTLQEIAALRCDLAGVCVWSNPLVPSLVAEYLRLPDGFDLETVAECPECFVEVLEDALWDGSGFADALFERVVEPAAHARGLLDTWPALTRMVTMLSPHEMTKDPLFGKNFDLPPVDRTSQLGTSNSFCDGAASFNLPDGRLVALARDGAPWPSIGRAVMPWASRVEQLVERGAPQVETDNEPLIEGLLTHYNEINNARPGVDVACDGSGSGTDGEVPGLIDDVVSAGSQPRDDEASGCACVVSPRRRGEGWVVALWALGLGAYVRRR